MNALRDKWDETLDELKKPEDISRLDTIDSLDKAISYYEGKQKKASAAEISDIARTISALEKKRDSLKQLARLPEMEQETGRLGGLGKAELKVELKAIGMDGLRKRIKELQDMLSDTKNPMSARQRKELTKLVASYEDYEKILRKSDVTVEKSWSSIKGIGGGISSLTETLQENRGAWATITGVIDSAIQIYQGVRTVISIVEALTAVTTASSAATTASGAATTAAATAKIASAPVEAAAATVSTVAAKAEAMAYRELAASEFMAAHAYIPLLRCGYRGRFHRHDAGYRGFGGRNALCQRWSAVRPDPRADGRVCRGEVEPGGGCSTGQTEVADRRQRFGARSAYGNTCTRARYRGSTGQRDAHQPEANEHKTIEDVHTRTILQ